jgi:anti-sigma regulatory factor (Ser/Thr protein kinase)
MGFRHEALLYAGDAEFVERTAAFVADSLDSGEPILVVVSAAKIEALRAELGDDREAVLFADMADVGSNPARIIPAWSDFVTRHGGTGRLRGIGEPIWAERSAAALVETQRHESLLNLAFAEARPWWLLCPYDTQTLAPEVIAEALRSHPLVSGDDGARSSADYRGLEAASAPFVEPLSEPPPGCRTLTFEAGPLKELRSLVAGEAARAGLDERRAGEYVLAAHEVASNSVRHGGGQGSLRLWREGDVLLCEIRDAGWIGDPLAGRRRPAPSAPDGRGLWLANQLCDLVQIRSSPAGTAVRLHAHLGRG